MSDLPIIDSNAANLELNARGHRFDRTLDRVANLLDSGQVDQWRTLPPILIDRASIYADFRAAYRAAVDAGAIADDRSNPTKEQ